MDKFEQFCEAVRHAPTATLATGVNGRISMRTVSPVYYDGAVLLFTCEFSNKYRQLMENPHCCIAVGPFFAEATAKFCGRTMLPENDALRKVYEEKFPDAFDENAVFGGRNASFLLLHPVRLSGWGFESDDQPEDGIPTVPFEITL